jgi:hypothetical protein
VGEIPLSEFFDISGKIEKIESKEKIHITEKKFKTFKKKKKIFLPESRYNVGSPRASASAFYWKPGILFPSPGNPPKNILTPDNPCTWRTRGPRSVIPGLPNFAPSRSSCGARVVFF